jgi:protein-S-isoprenylcysteine O-methyltransferase Ste14
MAESGLAMTGGSCMVIYKLVIFVIVSVGILIFSWKPLCNPRSHGFYRFFVFEGILFLILLNMEHWFQNPFSPLQIVSWLLLIISLFLAVHGFYLLRAIGKPKGSFENTTKLVRIGAYRYIRHPLYSSLLFLAWGAFFKNVSVTGGILAVAITAFLIATAKVEEKENLQRFGDEYAAYVKATRMFIPFLF